MRPDAKPRSRRLGLVAASLLAVLAVSPASALSLKEALAIANQQNPALQAQRHTVPAANAALDRARSGYLPRLSATSEAGFTRTGGAGVGSTSRTFPRGAGLELTQTLFDGWRTQSTVRQAGSQLGAAQANLRDVTQSILVETVTVYLDVLQAAAVLRFEKENQANLSEQLRLVSGLYEYSDVTQTDVLQVRARVSEAEGRVTAAEATWRNSMANFQRVVGVEPRNLSWPRPHDSTLPQTTDQAVALALTQHPAIEASAYSANAAWANVDIARSGYLPTVSVSASINRQLDGSSQGDRQTTSTVLGRITVPLFEGGETRARVTEAREVAHQRRFETDAVRAKIQSDVISAMNLHKAARARLNAVKVQMQAAASALKGVKEEFNLGQRTATSVLDAAQDLLRANIDLIGAHRDRVLSGFLVKQALGQMAPESMETLSFDPTIEPLGVFRSLTIPRPRSHPWAWELRQSGMESPMRPLAYDLRGDGSSAAAEPDGWDLRRPGEVDRAPMPAQRSRGERLFLRLAPSEPELALRR